MEIKINKTQERIDKLMEHIPDLPKSFNDWVMKKSIQESNYIFYKKKGRKVHGVCSSCGSRVVVEQATHNISGKCPNCEKRIGFKAINKAKYYTDSEIVSIMQKMRENQYVIRYFKVMKVFKNNEDTSNFPDEILRTLIEPEFKIYEGSREVITVRKNGITKWEVFEKLWDYKIWQSKWKNERKRSSFFNKELLRDSSPFIYKRNLKRLLKNTKWKYSGLDHFKGTYMNMGGYLYTYEEYPSVEMLSKVGANQLLSDIINEYTVWGRGIHGYIDFNEKLLGLSKSVFQRVVKLKIPARKVELLVVIEKMKRSITEDQVLWAIENTNVETFTELLGYNSANKMISYIESQSDDWKSANFVSTSWRDYLHQCEVLGFDLKKSYFMFPNNLAERHAEYSKVIKANEDKYINEGIIKTFNAWKELDYKEGPYKIVVARNQSMIIAEGSYMGHCVGGTTYTGGMAKGEKIILMLRKNDKPYSTIELSPKTYEIIQNHGKNYNLESDAIDFAENWLKKHVSKIKKKKLSEKITKTIKPRINAAPGGTYHERIAN